MRVAVVLSFLVLAGCSCYFVDQITESDSAILPEYVAYVTADERLSPEQRAAILARVERRLAIVEREAGRCEAARAALDMLMDELRAELDRQR